MTSESNTAPPMASVVMSVLNGERFLREAVESILSQSFRDFEFIIVDDGSTDTTASILDSYARTDPRVEVYHQENRGMAESWNRGCTLGRGKYIVRMDGDDIAVRDRLMRQIEYMEKHAEVGVLGGAVEIIDASGIASYTEKFPVTDTDIKEAMKLYCAFRHPSVVIRKAAFLSVGGYRSAVSPAEDYDLWLRMAERCKLANLSSVVLKYRVHLDNISHCQLRRQAVGALAARAAAKIRAGGGADPLWQGIDITADVLNTLGVTDEDIHKTVVDAYSAWVTIMWRVSQAAPAVQIFNDLLRFATGREIPKSALLDGRLAEACVRYREGRFFRAVVSVARAILARPRIVGRPAKRALIRLRRWLVD